MAQDLKQRGPRNFTQRFFPHTSKTHASARSMMALVKSPAVRPGD